jgi:hypothetical protein
MVFSVQQEKYFAVKPSNLRIPILSPDQINSLYLYTEDGYMDINTYLRGLEEPDSMTIEDVERHTSNISDGLKKLPVYNDVVFRGCYPDIRQHYELKPGKIFCDLAFLSTSKAEAAAKKFMYRNPNAVMFVITSHFSGRDLDCCGAVCIKREQEVLFGVGTKFEIDKVDGNYVYMHETVGGTKPSISNFAPAPTRISAEQSTVVDTPVVNIVNEPAVVASEPTTTTTQHQQRQRRHKKEPADNMTGEYGSVRINGLRRSARFQPKVGSVFVNGLRRSARLL